MDVIRLLNSKNRCLRKFLGLSREYLARFEKEGYGQLERFHKSRDRIIRALDLYDRKIAECIALIPTLTERQAMADQIRPILAERESIVREILSVDEAIILGIEKERQRIAEELGVSRKGIDALGRYKSGWIADSGEGIDTKL